uniref:CXXC-type domain-containing protein n=1 Tax=Rodentolepis nana TaxID=102285 RepID=A0A158QHN5_RODNA
LQKRYRKASRKSSSHEDEEPSDELLYCICRSSRGDGFMIACDNCEEWFHGECVNITAKQSDSIKSYYCQACRDENPALRVIYRNENASSRKTPGSRQKPTEVPSNVIDEIGNHHDRFNTIPSRKRNRKTAQLPLSKSRRATEASANQFADFSDGEFEMDQSQIASPSSSYSQSHPGPYPSRSRYERATPSNLDSIDHVDFHHSQQIRRLPFTRNARYSAPCGECESCKTRGNCGSCDVCRSPKFKQGRSRQYCITRMKMCQANGIEYAQSLRNSSPRGRLGPPCGECGSCKTKSNCGTCEFCRNPRAKQTRNRQFCLYKAKMCVTNCATSPTRQSSRYPSACHDDLHDIEFDPTFDEDFGQSRYLSTTRKVQGVVGSKMRRGDHLPGGRYSNDLSSVYPSRRTGAAQHPDFFIDNDFPDAFGISPSTYRNGSSRYTGPQGELEPRILRAGRGVVDASADALRSIEGAFDSDEDVVLPEMNACAGPACSKPALHGKYCSQDCRLRHESDNMNRTHPRYSNASSKDQVVTPYGLPYMDHIYCRHHRMLGAQQQQQVFNTDIQMGLQQQDIYPDVYTNFGGNQSGVIDYTYDPLAVSTQPGYNRRMPVSDDFLSLGNHHILHSRGGGSVVSHSRKFTGAQSSLVGGSRMITLSGRRQIRSGGSGVVTSADVLSPPVPLDSITPTMQSLRLYNGHPAIEFPSGDTESAAAAEILTAAEAGDLMGGVVDGSSPSGVGGNGVDGAIASSTSTAATVGAVPAFRQGEEYYMMNENENIEINWPSSPSGAPTASAGTS